MLNKNVSSFRHIYVVLLIFTIFGAIQTAKAENWPGWRGPRGDGTSIDQEMVINWDPAEATWKTELPGKGHASPIVWGDYIYTVTADTDTKERILLCLDRNSGSILWQETVVQGPLEKIHVENSYASSTPVTDGKRIYVTFRKGDDIVVAAHDLVNGKQLWIVQPGTHKGEWGFSNPPVLYDGKVIVDGDGKGDSFLIALNCENGQTLWWNDRTNKGISYSGPFIRQLAGKMQLIQCGDRCVTSFDPGTGKMIWKVDGPSQEFVSTPVYSESAGLIFISSSWPKTQILAIRPDGVGNVTDSHIAWSDSKGAPYVPSMIVAGNLLFSVNKGGMVYCYEAESGLVHWKEKLGRQHSSPVLVNGMLYFINDNGQINVIKPGKTYQHVARYEMNEMCYASPAISEGQVFVRGFKHMFCFGKHIKPIQKQAKAEKNELLKE